MGELATMKEELKDVVGGVIRHCKDDKYISADVVWDVDSAAEEIERL